MPPRMITNNTLDWIIGILGIVGVLLLITGVILMIILLSTAKKRPNHKKKVSAGFWKRVAVYITDSFALGLILSILGLPFVMHMGQEAYKDSPQYLVVLMITIGVNVYLYFKHGRTMGDFVMHTKVIDAKTKKKPSPGQLLGRFFAKILSIIPLGLGFMWAGWEKEKKAWHDSLSKTRYVEIKKYSGAFTIIINTGFILMNGLVIVMTLLFLYSSMNMAGSSDYAPQQQLSEEQIQQLEESLLQNNTETVSELENDTVLVPDEKTAPETLLTKPSSPQ